MIVFHALFVLRLQYQRRGESKLICLLCTKGVCCCTKSATLSGTLNVQAYTLLGLRCIWSIFAYNGAFNDLSCTMLKMNCAKFSKRLPRIYASMHHERGCGSARHSIFHPIGNHIQQYIYNHAHNILSSYHLAIIYWWSCSQYTVKI